MNEELKENLGIIFFAEGAPGGIKENCFFLSFGLGTICTERDKTNESNVQYKYCFIL